MKKFTVQLSLSLLILVLLVLGSCSDNNRLPKVTHGKIERLTPIASKYISDRAVDVWLPDQYDGRTGFPVLYMHDGQMLFDPSITWNSKSWEIDSITQTLIDRQEIEPLIIVGIHNAPSERHSNYFPEEPFNQLSKATRDSLTQLYRTSEIPLFGKPINSDDYLIYIVEELIPKIDSIYTTKKVAEGRIIAGSSMGGLISWYATIKYPEVFGGAACLSTHWPGVFTNENNPIPATFIEYLSETLPPVNSRKFYFDHGTSNLDSLYEIHQKQINQLFSLTGYDSLHYRSLIFEGAGHDEKAWSERFSDPLKFFFQPKH